MAWWLIVPGVPLALLAGLWLVGERGQPLGLPSTRAALKGSDGGDGRRLDLKTVHGYIYGRWSKQYIGFCIHHLLPRMGERLKGRWADRYHGKVLPTDLAKAIITLDHDIERQDLEQIIPYPIARDIVLTGPPDVVLLDCPCRLARENPCEPIQVCMIVGDGAFVLDHLPESSRRVDQAEALALLEAEHARGHVHVAYFKDACDDRFYAICNCCSCCCGGIEAMVAYGVPMVASSGYIAQVEADLCAACGECEDACPFDAVYVEDTAVVDWAGCMGCGVCVDRCTTGAVTLVADGRKGVPLDVRAL